jgi:predicted ATPase
MGGARGQRARVPSRVLTTRGPPGCCGVVADRHLVHEIADANLPLTDFRWQFNAVVGRSRGTDAHLTHDAGAELWVRDGRLARGPGYETIPAASRRELARAGAILRLRRGGRYHLHASGVVDPRGRAWVLSGVSGSGKSTLAYALARVGWRVLGDDGVILERVATGVTAHAWREDLWVSTDLNHEFPELQGQAVLNDARRRLPRTMPVARRGPLVGMVFLTQGPIDHLARITAVEALVQLIAQSAWVLIPDDDARRHLDALRAIATQVPAYRLTHSPRQLHVIDQTLLAAA